jgi:integrase
MQPYRFQRLHGEFCLVYSDGDGKRHRHRLGTADAREAERLAPAVYAELTRPQGSTVDALWRGYTADKAGRPITANMAHTWKPLKDRFGPMEATAITVADCRAHVADRRKRGIKDWTIYTELGRLRMVLRWAEKHRLIDKAPHIERPSQPPPKEHHLTREQARKLIEAAQYPHIRLYILALLSTGARTSALLELTWDRCDFARELIDLRNPAIARRHKGRAIVPMTRTLKAALLEARQGTISDHVIEWAGKPVQKPRRALARAGKVAGIGHVHPHLLRHSAAAHMAEDGVPLEEISQFLGHSDINVTRKIYARFSPDYLRKAAASLEYDDLGALKLRKVQRT